ncbi:MAG: chemotaxis protein CheD [Treponema sp.]|nr:chemotaxis protein CheD [Treponema sp.]MBQ7881474.1 chemotaxis protein CheD [Treponema sp.]
MNKYFDLHFNKDIITIYPGEFWSSSGPELISTVLGSCVSITLHDPISGIGGMNHFMLAKNSNPIQDKNDRLLGRFGDHAMSMLIEDMECKGAVISRCYAKVFGGGNIFNVQNGNKNHVGESNIKFALEFLENHKIPIKSSDVGGTLPRKIFFDPVTSKVYLKHINNKNDDPYFKSLFH